MNDFTSSVCFYNNWANPSALIGPELWFIRVYTMEMT